MGEFVPPHTLIVGSTLSGKSTLAKNIAHEHARTGIPVIVLDPNNDDGWPSVGFQTTDPDEFLYTAKHNTQCLCIIDEGAQNAGRYDKEMHWTAQTGRHWGHRFIYVSQAPVDIAKAIRRNCGNIAAFSICPEDAQAMARDFNERGLLQATELKQGQYLFVTRFRPIQKLRVF